jgi:3-dehydroquinate dehydratase-2
MRIEGARPGVLVLQGPNLNLLGVREPERYGRTSLADVQRELDQLAAELGLQLRHVQSNHEGALIDAVHQARADQLVGAVVNAGAYTHTSIGLRDALLGVGLPFVEVHVSNVAAREPFRHVSLLSDVAVGVVFGFGTAGYALALRGLAGALSTPRA